MVINITSILKSNNTIEVAVKKNFTLVPVNKIRLYEDGKVITSLRCASKTESNSTFIYSFKLDVEIKVGHYYEIADELNEFTPLDITVLAKDPSFEKKYRYDGKLGAIYSKEETIFRVFSPLAHQGSVKLVSKDGKISYAPLLKIEGGVLEAVVKEDLEGYGYIYILNICGELVQAVDPYAKSVNANSRMGFVVDEKKLDAIPYNYEYLKPWKKWNQSVIYELDVRDMTSLTKVKNKGTYSALSKTNLVSDDDFPIGLDYISSLNITHVQLLPVYDFQTIDDENPTEYYNWGYDPLFYFSPEGSYSLNPSDPYSRMNELKSLISALHKKGIRVNMDVVFNHVFNRFASSFEKLCPYYYFRLNSNGDSSNGSFCGNDFESTHYMARKLIIDAVCYFAKVYGFDGFRFDLMGIIDKKTMHLLYKALKEIKPDIMVYGEGWDMPTCLAFEEKSSLNNTFDKDLIDIGFFNDRFRDVLKGKTDDSNLQAKGYLNGDLNYRDGFKHVFVGSTVSYGFPAMFDSTKQTINYVECHDNATLFDKLAVSNKDETIETRLRRIKLINACTILSLGVPLIHAGQEVGLSKNGVCNSYNSGDAINGFRYDIASNRKDMIKYLNDIIRLKKYFSCFYLDRKEEIVSNIEFEDLQNGAVAIKLNDNERKCKVIVIVNPSDATVKYQFDKYYRIIFNEAGLLESETYSQLVLVNGITMLVACASNKE